MSNTPSFDISSRKSKTEVEATPEVQIDPSVADLINDPTVAPEPEQVKEEEVVFVAFEDFEGRINQRTYHFVKDVPVRCPLEEANTWLDAKKGYLK